MTALVGRDEDIAALREAAAVALDRARLVVVDGVAGIGKSVLLAELRSFAAEATFSLFAADADPLESDRPFAPLIDALGLWSLEEGRPLGRPSLFELAGDARYRTVDRITTFVEDLCSRGPVAIVIDDLHAADASSALVIRKLRQRLAASPLLLAVGTRPFVASEPEAHRLLGFLRSDADLHLRVEPLQASDVAALVRRETGADRIGPRLGEALAKAAGVPMLVLGITKGLVREGAVQTAGSGAGSVAELGAATVESADGLAAIVRRRLETLGPTARELVSVAAVLGEQFRVDWIESMLGLLPSQFESARREAAASGLLDASYRPLRLEHDLIRDAVLDALTVGERAWLHRRAVAQLISSEAPASIVAAYLDSTGDAADDEIREWHRSAARSVEHRSPATAARLYERALAVTPPGHPLHDELAVARFGSCAAAGMTSEAEEIGALLSARALSDELALTVSWWEGGIAFLRNRQAEAARIYEAAANRVGPSAAAAQCLGMAAICHLVALDADMGDAHLRALEAAEATRDPIALTLACMSGCRVLADEIRFDESRALIERALSVADADRTLEAHRFQPHFVAGLAMLDVGRIESVLHQVERGRRRCNENGTNWAESMYHGLAAVVHLKAGRLDSAFAEANAGVESADDSGVRIAAPWCLAVGALVSIHQGDADAARRRLDLADADLSSGGALGIDLVALARSLHLRLTDPVAADEHLLGAWEVLQAVGHPPGTVALASEMLAAGIRRSDNSLLESLRADVWRWSANGSVKWLSWIVDVIDALGSSDPSAFTSLDTLLPWEGEAPPLDVAAVALELAHLPSVPAVVRVQLVRRIEAVLVEAGADATLERCRARFGPTEGRRGRPARRRTIGWESLTATENLVVEHLVAGRSNREIGDRLGIGVRTVETHVSRILNKLGESSRLAVVAAAGRKRSH